jgi:hypothetical protein
MTARASAEQREARRPWITTQPIFEALKERIKWRCYFALSVLSFQFTFVSRGDAPRSALAPGYHIPRLWRLRRNSPAPLVL